MAGELGFEPRQAESEFYCLCRKAARQIGILPSNYRGYCLFKSTGICTDSCERNEYTERWVGTKLGHASEGSLALANGHESHSENSLPVEVAKLANEAVDCKEWTADTTVTKPHQK